MGGFLLPEDVLDVARSLYNNEQRSQWPMGDFLVDVVDELWQHYSAGKPDGYDMEYYRARAKVIYQVAIAVGCDTTTLRDREGMARFFPEEVRRKYDMLSYHQLRACKSAGDEWEKYAEWAAENLPAPVAMIRRKIKAKGDYVAPWVSKWERIVVLAEAIKDDIEAPSKVRTAAKEILRMGVQTPP